jgi:hypothetical protein
MGSEETTDGHVSKFIALELGSRLNAVRRWGVFGFERMCLELVKNAERRELLGK